jgi:dihydrofolate reductase
LTDLIIIAAIAKNNVIGMGNRIPWHIKEDFVRFKKLTMGHPIIMGRRTFQSLPIKPLPGRQNIVVSRDFSYMDTIVKPSIEEAIDFCKDSPKIFIIGGASIYEHSIRYANVLELTIIDKDYEGDTFFPKIDLEEWQLVKKEPHEGFTFKTFVRKNNKFEKPQKIIYDFKQQNEVYNHMVETLRKIFDSDERIKEIIVYGSASMKEFGDYRTTYKPGTPTARDKSDIDTVFLIEGFKGDPIKLNNGYLIKEGGFVKDENGNDVHVDGHPILAAPVRTPEKYYKNINKPFPEGFDFTKEGKSLFKRNI